MKLGIFTLTEEGLKEVPPKPVTIRVGGKKVCVRPDNPMYETVCAYGHTSEYTEDEKEIENICNKYNDNNFKEPEAYASWKDYEESTLT